MGRIIPDAGSRMIRSCVSVYITCIVMVNLVVPTGREPHVLLRGVVVEALDQNRSCLHHHMEFGLNVALVCAVVGGLHVCERRRRRLPYACQTPYR